jgi:hypothetical protein
MNIEQPLRHLLLEQISINFKIGQPVAEQVLAIIEKENHYKDNIQQEQDIAGFIKGSLQLYLYPNNLSLLKIYDQKYLDENNIKLDFIKIIPDGWDCSLYFDKQNNLYWEDNYGRYSKEGFKISPYIDALKFYK